MNVKQYKKLFKKLRITDQKIADYCGYSRPTITKILNLKEFPNEVKLNHLMKEWDNLIHSTLEEKDIVLNVDEQGNFELT